MMLLLCASYSRSSKIKKFFFFKITKNVNAEKLRDFYSDSVHLNHNFIFIFKPNDFENRFYKPNFICSASCGIQRENKYFFFFFSRFSIFPAMSYHLGVIWRNSYNFFLFVRWNIYSPDLWPDTANDEN